MDDVATTTLARVSELSSRVIASILWYFATLGILQGIWHPFLTSIEAAPSCCRTNL